MSFSINVISAINFTIRKSFGLVTMKKFILMAVLLIEIESCTIVPSNLDEKISYPDRVAQGSQKASIPAEPIDHNSTASSIDLKPISIDEKSWEYLEELRPIIVNQGRKLEKLLTEFAEKSINQRATYWLKQLKMILKELSIDRGRKSKNLENKINEVVDQTMSLPDKKILKNTDVFGDLADSAEKLDIYYQQDEQDGEKHVKSRYEDPSASFSFLSESPKETRNVRTTKNDVEQLNNMLIDMQNQMFRVRQYFEKICRKHHSVSSEHNHIGPMGPNQPKKISML